MKANIVEREKKIVLPNVAERRQVHLINPASCGGKRFESAIRVAESTGNEVIITEHKNHAREITAELFAKDKFAHVIVYGGDGTINEVVNGIMDSGNNHTASFSVMPFGSGNDFSHLANDMGDIEKTELTRIDLGKANGRYFANMINIGFDCNVVVRVEDYKKKPHYNGKTAYIKGVVGELIHKSPLNCEVILDDKDKFNMPLILTACANGRYCGGGFKAAPLASLNDGLLDVMIIKDVTRRKFISLVGDYKLGTYIDENGEVGEKFVDVITYRRCKKYRVNGIKYWCCDGEIIEDDTVEVEVVPEAVWFVSI